MSKDRRYKGIKALIESGHIKTIADIFDTIPKSLVARDFGTNNVRFSNLIKNPELFRLKELYLLASLFEVDEAKIIYLAYNQYLQSSKKGKK